MNRFAHALRRFNTAARHWEADHPARWGALYALTFAVVWTAFSLVSLSWATFAFAIPFIIVTTGLQAYAWRPGGWKRRRYERWAALRNDLDLATGWYADPTGRHKMRYMDRSKWTRRVADEGNAFIDRGVLTRDYRAADTRARRSRAALPLLVGLAVGGAMGAALLVTALAFPHTSAFAFVSAGNTRPIGVGWWAVGVIVGGGVAASVLSPARDSPQVTAESSAGERVDKRERARAFLYSFGTILGFAILVAWPTWIQFWRDSLLPMQILPFVVLGGLVGATLAGAVLAIKVARLERADHARLRSRGVMPALRGAYITMSSS